MTDGYHPDNQSVEQHGSRESSLRARALARYQESLASACENLVELPSEEVLKIIRELRIHQIELEMQNEELIQSHIALEESRARFRDLYDHAPVGYCLVTGPDGQIQDCNSTLGEMLGYEPIRLNGERFFSVIEKSHQDVFYHLKRRIIASRQPDSCELQMKRSDGSCMWVQLSVTMAATGADAADLRISFMNIDDRIRAETAKCFLESQLRESQKMEAIGTLAGGIAHDFNNILAVILVNAEVAIRMTNQTATSAVPFVNEIQKAADRARDLVRQILAFCRKQPTDRHTVSLTDVIQESISLLRSTMPARFDLKFTWDPGVPQVSADSTQIEQVVINLATNAMQAMEGKAGQLSIHLDVVQLNSLSIEDLSLRSESWQQCDQVVRLVFVDDGPGMTPDVAERIFEPFFTTKPVNEGTGLGLAVVHGIIRAHDGEIFVESKPGHGTKFTIYLPAATQVGIMSDPELTLSPLSVAAERESKPAHADSSVTPKLNEWHILYVDDDQWVLKSIMTLLKEYDIMVSGYTDPAVALNALGDSSTKSKILVTDYNMPGLSGLDFTRQVRKLYPKLPVVITSGFIDEELRAKAREAGAVALVEKPFSTKVFLEVLAEITQRRPA